MQRHLGSNAGFLAATLMLACADDAGEAQFPVESGLDEKRTLQTLSGTEAKQLCHGGLAATDMFFDSDEMANLLCTFAAAASSIAAGDRTAKVNVAVCEKARMECLAKPVKHQREGDPCTSFSIPSKCAVSVGEFERCTERYFEVLLKDWNGVSCASLAAQPSLKLPGGQPANASEVPGCERLQSACPEGEWPAVTLTVQRMASRP